MLEESTRGDEDGYRISPIFNNCVCILDEYIWSSEISEERIMESRFLENTAVFLFRNIKFKKSTLVALTNVLANCIR